MPDIAREKSNKILEEIEERITKEYEQARKEIDERLSKHLERFAVKDAEKRTALKAGEITKKEYRQWRSNQFLTGKRWEDLRDTIAKDLINKQAIAKSITNGYMPEVYALNHNFIAESVSEELDFKITFSLYNKNTVENLMKHNDILPPPGKRMNAKFARGEAIRWERGQIQSVAMQSILQGESIPKMSKRIAQTLSVRNRADSIRYARTACTGAENKGRLDGMQKLSDDGIVLDKQWTATGDDRTRQSHLDIDGESVPPNEPFSNGLMYPGDPAGSADEVWNCRCSMGSVVAGFRRKDGSISKVNYKREEDQHDREIKAERNRRGTQQREVKKDNDNPDNLSQDLLNIVGNKSVSISPEELLKNINPNFNDESYKYSLYHENCQRCVACYELGRRGYNVEALPFDGGYSSTGSIFNMYKYKTDDTYLYKENEKYKINRSPKTTANSIEKAMKDWGDGSRATLSVEWRGGNTAHIVNVENFNGTIKILDAQCGKSYTDLEKYLSETKCAKTELLRTDTLKFKDEINVEQAKNLCKPRKD